jgi:WD40 repeat protein
MPRVSGTRAQLRICASATAGGYVADLAWSSDGRSIAVADDAGVVSVGVVAIDDGSLLPVCEHPGGALCVAWSPGSVLASGGRDGAVALDGGAIALQAPELAEPPRHAGAPWIERLAWRPDGRLLAAAVGRRVVLWSPEGVCEDVSEPLPATVTCLAWHPKGVLCAAGSYGGVRLLRGKGARAVQSLEWTGSVLEVAFSPDGRRLAHGNQDASVHFWDLRRGGELEMAGYATKVRELAWSPDGRWLATGGGEGVTLWDFHRPGGPAGSRPLQLSHDERIVALAFQPGGELLAAADRGGTVRVWRPGHDDLPVGGTALSEAATVLAWSPDGTHLAVGGARGSLLVVSVETGS